MNGIIKVNNKTIHSDWTLMQSFMQDDGTFRLTFADKNSKDTVRFELLKEDYESLNRILTRELSKETKKDPLSI
jgi:hypothetical protein